MFIFLSFTFEIKNEFNHFNIEIIDLIHVGNFDLRELMDKNQNANYIVFCCQSSKQTLSYNHKLIESKDGLIQIGKTKQDHYMNSLFFDETNRQKILFLTFEEKNDENMEKPIFKADKKILKNKSFNYKKQRSAFLQFLLGSKNCYNKKINCSFIKPFISLYFRVKYLR